jgi:hypothetical protein
MRRVPSYLEPSCPRFVCEFRTVMRPRIWNHTLSTFPRSQQLQIQARMEKHETSPHWTLSWATRIRFTLSPQISSQLSSSSINFSSLADFQLFLTDIQKFGLKPLRVYIKLHNDELHNLYSSPNIVRVIKWRRMRCAGHVARMEEGRSVYRVLVGRPEGKIPLASSAQGPVAGFCEHGMNV